MSSTLGASLLRTVLSDGTLKILGSGLDKGPIIVTDNGDVIADYNHNQTIFINEIFKCYYAQEI